MDLNDRDWGAETEVKKDSAGSGTRLTLEAIKKARMN